MVLSDRLIGGWTWIKFWQLRLNIMDWRGRCWLILDIDLYIGETWGKHVHRLLDILSSGWCWWFQTFLFSIIYGIIMDNPSHWPIFFRGVETTKQSWSDKTVQKLSVESQNWRVFSLFVPSVQPTWQWNSSVSADAMGKSSINVICSTAMINRGYLGVQFHE